MDSLKKLSWSAPEYEEREHSADWFWALGIIIIASSGASLIYENYFFAALLILSGVLLGFFAMKKPDMVEYELNEKGLKINNQLYAYDSIKAFFVKIENKPTLFIKSERMFMPVISIPIDNNMAEEIHTLFLEKNISEEEMREHPSEKIMEVLGF